MTLAPQGRIQERSGQDAAKVRLAGSEDAAAIAHLCNETRCNEAHAGPLTVEDAERNLEQGGALLLENTAGKLLCVLMWLEAPHGWTLQQPAVLAAYQHQELDRWVLTKLEALAIKRNIPLLEMRLSDDSLRSYYARMGYRPNADDAHLLSKRVGGTWQKQGD